MGFWESLFGGHHGGRNDYRDSHGGHSGNGRHALRSRSFWKGGDPLRRLNEPAPSKQVLRCPLCSMSNSPDARFCSQCASSLLPALCARCRSPLPAGTKFCSQCGNPASDRA